MAVGRPSFFHQLGVYSRLFFLLSQLPSPACINNKCQRNACSRVSNIQSTFLYL